MVITKDLCNDVAKKLKLYNELYLNRSHSSLNLNIGEILFLFKNNFLRSLLVLMLLKFKYELQHSSSFHKSTIILFHNVL